MLLRGCYLAACSIHFSYPQVLSQWKTQGELLSSDYNHHTKICYAAMLMGGRAVGEEVCYGKMRKTAESLCGQAPL